MNVELTELVFILDRSGSMNGLESDTIGGFNGMISKQKAEGEKVNVTTVLFDDEAEIIHDRFPIDIIEPLTDKEYYVRGCTALLDAVGQSIKKIENVQKHLSDEHKAGKVIFVITTDGLENSGVEYGYNDIKKMIEAKKECGWEFLFLGANIDAGKEAEKMGIAIHSDRIMIGIVMVLISTLGVINGLRDVVQRNFTSGALEIMNSVLGALGIAFGIALAMKMLHGGGNAGGAVLNSNIFVQAVSVSVGSIGLAGIYQIRGKKVIYSGIGAFLTWTVYLIVRQFGGSYLFGMLLAAVFVGMYAFVMARINKAPSTIFLTASVFPLMPGANLYYMMYGCVKQNLALAIEHMILLVETCLMIVFGFLLVDIVSRIVMRILGQEYHIGKNQ